MIAKFKRLETLFGKRNTHRYLRTYTLGAISSLLEAISLALTLPVVSYLSGNQKIKSTWLAEWGTHHLLLLLCVFYVLALAFRIFANERIAHINMTEGYALSAEIFKKSLDQPYSWNFSNHSADTRASILHDTQDLISFITIPLGRLISQISLLLAIVIVLLWIQPVLTLFLGFIFSAIYFLIYIFMKVGLQKDARIQLDAHTKRHRLSTDAYIANRELRLHQLEGKFIEDFGLASQQLAHASKNRATLSEIPKLIMEAVLFVGLIAAYLYHSSSEQTAQIQNGPVYLLYAVAFLKILPIGHQIFVNFSSLKSGWPLVEKFEKLFKGFSQKTIQKAFPREWDVIEFKNVSYSYPNATTQAIENLSFTAKAGEKIAIIGKSGSGKSTLIDLLACLIHPSKGEILVNSKSLFTEHADSWRQQIRYSSQSPALLDGTVLNNISLNKAYTEQELNSACYLACLDDFDSEEAYSLFLNKAVGENGLNLSGGQIKRISIARAMFHSASLYIFDEPTSSLDPQTASKFIQRILKMNTKSVFFFVTHDHHFASQCDRVINLDE